MSAPTVALDIQGIQSVDHRDRGVARYVLELALALEAGHGDRMAAYLLNPDLGPPGRIEPLLATGKVLGGFGLTEPSAGSDAASTRTTAVRKGAHYAVHKAIDSAHRDIGVVMQHAAKYIPRFALQLFFSFAGGVAQIAF